MKRTATGQYDYGPIYGYIEHEKGGMYVVSINAPFQYEEFRFPMHLCEPQATIGDYVRISASESSKGVELTLESLTNTEYSDAIRERGTHFETAELEAWRDLESKLES